MKFIENFFPWIFIGGFLALFCIIALVSSFMEKKRREKMMQVAESLKLQFFPGSKSMFSSAAQETPLQAQLSHFKLFTLGRARRVSNMIFGDAGGTELAIFDYRYKTGSGKNSHTWRQSVLYMKSDALQVPQLMARPEHFFDKVGGMLGFKDINFDEHPEFSAAFKLDGAEESAVRQLFTKDLMDYFLQHREMTVEASGSQMVFYRTRRRVKPDEIKQFMQDGFEVCTKLQEAAAQSGPSA